MKLKVKPLKWQYDADVLEYSADSSFGEVKIEYYDRRYHVSNIDGEYNYKRFDSEQEAKDYVQMMHEQNIMGFIE